MKREMEEERVQRKLAEARFCWMKKRSLRGRPGRLFPLGHVSFRSKCEYLTYRQANMHACMHVAAGFVGSPHNFIHHSFFLSNLSSVIPLFYEGSTADWKRFLDANREAKRILSSTLDEKGYFELHLEMEEETISRRKRILDGRAQGLGAGPIHGSLL